MKLRTINIMANKLLGIPIKSIHIPETKQARSRWS